jgi:SAM-dependent methyltransferase
VKVRYASLRGIWRKEYNVTRGYPSSSLSTPSGSVRYFARFLRRKHGDVPGRVIDLGAGRGRNAVYLAREGFAVVGVDFVPDALSSLVEHARKEGLEKTVAAVVTAIGYDLPFVDSSFDAAIDMFCYPYLVNEALRGKYRVELARVLRPRGLFLLTVPAKDDGFYGPLLEGDMGEDVVVDPFNQIPSMVLDKKRVVDDFSKQFRVEGFVHKSGTRKMYDQNFKRSTLVFVMRRLQDDP